MLIKCWGDLKQFGLVPMTGEACALGMRMLVEVEPRGEVILHQFFNVYRMEYHSFGKSKTVMLPRSIFNELAVFCLLTLPNIVEVWDIENFGMNGIEQKYAERAQAVWEEAQKHEMQSLSGRITARWRRNRYGQPTNAEGTVNVHTFSGVCP